MKQYDFQTILPENVSVVDHDHAGFPKGCVRLEYASFVDGSSDYAMMVPPESQGQDTWVVTIHGHGAEGNQVFVRSDVKKHWLPEFLRHGFGILSPTLRGNAWMGPEAVADLDSLLNYLRNEFGARRFVFYGGSMGGTSSMAYAALRPCNVDALAVLGGTCDMIAYYHSCRAGMKDLPLLGEIADAIEKGYGGTPEEQPLLYRTHSPIFSVDTLKEIPFYLGHGETDVLMPVEQSRRMAAAMAEAPRFIYHEIQGKGHDAPLLYGQQCSDDCSFNILDWLVENMAK